MYVCKCRAVAGHAGPAANNSGGGDGNGGCCCRISSNYNSNSSHGAVAMAINLGYSANAMASLLWMCCCCCCCHPFDWLTVQNRIYIYIYYVYTHCKVRWEETARQGQYRHCPSLGGTLSSISEQRNSCAHYLSGRQMANNHLTPTQQQPHSTAIYCGPKPWRI